MAKTIILKVLNYFFVLKLELIDGNESARGRSGQHLSSWGLSRGTAGRAAPGRAREGPGHRRHWRRHWDLRVRVHTYVHIGNLPIRMVYTHPNK